MIKNSKGIEIPLYIITEIKKNEGYLGQLDSLGDGDHGINMSKGMTIALKNILADGTHEMTTGFEYIKEALLEYVGGSMGPLYGMMFRGFIRASKGKEEINSFVVASMLNGAVSNIETITDARVGDKSLLDSLVPAAAAFSESIQVDQDFEKGLRAMAEASQRGLESTRNLKSNIGRSVRLGDKTIGHLDAGAASCNIILNALSESMIGIERGVWHATLSQ